MTVDRDNVLSSLIAAEIKALRKGRGIRTRDLDQRLGPHLHDLIGHQAIDLAELRRRLASELTAVAARLPDDLRAAVLVSLGIGEEARPLTLFGDRVSYLARQIGCTERTVLRRISVAEQLLAEELAGDLPRRASNMAEERGWYLEELRTVLLLDTATPEAHERRRIVATRSGLTHVTASLDMPKDGDEAQQGRLDARLLHGGRLIRRADPVGDRFEFVVELPAPLEAGQTHEYELILRVAPGTRMRPHYIFTPEYKCHLFDLTVRFDLEHPPAWVRRVSRETVRTFDSAILDGDQMSLNNVGEVHVRFGNPVMYLGYGLQWRF